MTTPGIDCVDYLHQILGSTTPSMTLGIYKLCLLKTFLYCGRNQFFVWAGQGDNKMEYLDTRFRITFNYTTCMNLYSIVIDMHGTVQYGNTVREQIILPLG
jgi:hypothetical protein